VKVYRLERLIHGKYEKKSIISLGRLLNQNKVRLLSFRKNRGYVLADRAEESNGSTILYGFVRGDGLTSGQKVHIAGAGDFDILSIRELDDPCPLHPKETSQRTLRTQERRLYAPMCEVSGLVIDDDSIYVDLPRHATHFTKPSELNLPAEDQASLESEVVVTKGVKYVRDLQSGESESDDDQMQLFSGVFVPSGARAEAELEPGITEEEEEGEDESEDDDEEVVEEEEVNEEREEPSGEVKPGRYARIEFADMPAAFFEIFDPRRPIVIGGLLEDEIGEASQQWVKIKRHRFYARKPKSNDPLIVTIGWRRYQCVPTFFNEERGERLRFLKYMPDFLTCWATFYGPPSAVNVGVTAFQYVTENLETFRITATGVTVAQMGDGNIVKKLRVNGHPKEIFQKTAKISNMFTSDIEATQFVGGLVRTVSGIRGVIKKVEKDGVVRCTFEDTVKPSDIVFLNTWVKVQPTELFTPVNSLLSAEWGLIRTTAQMRAELGLRPEYREDSVYRDVERPEYKEQVLRVPKALKAELPYAVKKKFERTETQRAQILNEDEAHILNLVRKTSEVYEARRKEKAKETTAEETAKKKVADLEQEALLRKRTQRKQAFFKRNPKWVHKK
jgi:ribosome biogenesis protein BMS1